MTKKSLPAVKIQLIPSAVESSPIVEKIISLSGLGAKDFTIQDSRIEILNPGSVPTMKEKDWIDHQKIGKKTLSCIKNVW